MDTKHEAKPDTDADEPATRRRRRSSIKPWIVSGIVIIVLAGSWLYTDGKNVPKAMAEPPLPQVTVSHPLVHDLDTRVGFLGQFSAIDKVEVRAQVGGTLTGIFFKDGAEVHKGQLLFTIDPVPYEIRLSQAKAQLESSRARFELAKQEFDRADVLQHSDAGTVQSVEQRTSDVQTARAAVDDANAQIRDAQFDLDHCRISAPFSGRIGSHLVSVGNLIAGSRAATSPTTLLATLVSSDPIYLDFDMSESDYQSFLRYRSAQKGSAVDGVELGLGDEAGFPRHGKLDFVNNVIDRSSGTIRTRATVPNADFSLTPGEFSRVRVIVAQPAPVLLLPDAAVLPDQSQHTVLTVASDGTVVAKPVTVGEIRGGLRVIRSGLSKDDRVIIDGLPFAAPGAKVTARDGTIQYAANQD